MAIEDFLRPYFPSHQLSFAEEDLQRLGYSLSGSYLKPAGIFYPHSKGDVLKIVHLANEAASNPKENARIVLFPISRGRNFGYNEAQGTAAGQLIVDLSRMNSIVDVNEK